MQGVSYDKKTNTFVKSHSIVNIMSPKRKTFNELYTYDKKQQHLPSYKNQLGLNHHAMVFFHYGHYVVSIVLLLVDY